MAMLQNEQTEQHQQQPNPLFCFDSLYCDEEKWQEEEVEEDSSTKEEENPSFFRENEELLCIFSKEKQQHKQNHLCLVTDPILSPSRSMAIDWILKANAHCGFSALTAVLAINYVDRFLSSHHFQRDKPWMNQLVAVSCLSLAAKVEEVQVPLLLDLQMQETKYIFEAKTIQRMEILILSTLQWKMHPVTPYSFIDRIVRRLRLKSNLHWEFLVLCDRLLLSVLSDPRSVIYLPSVLATATMTRVIDQIEPCNSMDYQNQLLAILNISKEKVNECYNLILEVELELVKIQMNDCNYHTRKRKYELQIPVSPSGVIDAVLSSDCSNDSWVMGSSVCSSLPEQPELPFKKSRDLSP